MKQKLPEFLEKYDFDQESYDAFLKKQTQSPNIDDFGNLILNSNIEDGSIKSVDKYVMKVTANKKCRSCV